MKICCRLLLIAVLISCNYITVAQSSLNYSIQNTNSGSLAFDNLGNNINTTSAPNLVANWSSNTRSTLQSLGFEFIFMGKYYTHFVAGTNGQVGLGLSTSPLGILSGNGVNDLTRTIAYPPTPLDNAPVLAAFWDKMTTPSTGGTVRSVLTGTAPNRCRV
ncbi:MAG TPA: hypothetical protein VLR49_03585, partial [Ferruginibacter sp.]|nr:hypothetical protein [Ferruginibacter sp.]